MSKRSRNISVINQILPPAANREDVEDFTWVIASVSVEEALRFVEM